MVYGPKVQYDAGAGRSTQQDPIGVAGGANVYGFGSGDPVNYQDPFGLWPLWLSQYLYTSAARSYPSTTNADMQYAVSGMFRRNGNTLGRAQRALNIRNQMDAQVAALISGSVENEFGTIAGLYNGIGDAMRHAAAACQMLREMPEDASRILSGHEDFEKNPTGEHRMDARNNSVGLRMASREGSCLDLATQAVRSGDLTTAPVKSSP